LDEFCRIIFLLTIADFNTAVFLSSIYNAQNDAKNLPSFKEKLVSGQPSAFSFQRKRNHLSLVGLAGDREAEDD